MQGREQPARLLFFYGGVFCGGVEQKIRGPAAGQDSREVAFGFSPQHHHQANLAIILPTKKKRKIWCYFLYNPHYTVPSKGPEYG